MVGPLIAPDESLGVRYRAHDHSADRKFQKRGGSWVPHPFAFQRVRFFPNPTTINPPKGNQSQLGSLYSAVTRYLIASHPVPAIASQIAGFRSNTTEPPTSAAFQIDHYTSRPEQPRNPDHVANPSAPFGLRRFSAAFSIEPCPSFSCRHKTQTVIPSGASRRLFFGSHREESLFDLSVRYPPFLPAILLSSTLCGSRFQPRHRPN
jgi:hypothetical protein